MSNYLLKASTFTIINSGIITFSANVDQTSPAAESCMFYLYNSNDSVWPATYSRASYELRFMTYTGLPSFGQGRSILGDTTTNLAYPHGLLRPPSTYFSSSGSLITISLSETKNKENMNIIFNVHPRNL
jgi:hypothetical protein